MENLKPNKNFKSQIDIFNKLKEIILNKKDVQLVENTDEDIQKVLSTGEKEFCEGKILVILQKVSLSQNTYQRNGYVVKIKSHFDENKPQLWEGIELTPVTTEKRSSIKVVDCFYKGCMTIKDKIISEDEIVYSNDKELEEKLIALLELLDQKEQKLVD